MTATSTLTDASLLRPGSLGIALVVADDAGAREPACDELSRRGWRVIEADSLDSAASLCGEITVDVMLVAAGLLEAGTGWPFARGARPIPVVAWLDLPDEISVLRLMRAGAAEFFVANASTWSLLSARLLAVARSARLSSDLEESRQRLARVQRLARLGTWEWDLASRWVWLSNQASQVAALPEGAHGLPEAQVWSRFEAEDQRRIRALFQTANERRGALSFEAPLKRSDGRLCVVQIEAEVEFDELDRPARVRGVVMDVTQRRAAETRIRELASSDLLTGLANRRQFGEVVMQSINQARAQGRGVGVIFLGLDRFKPINDTLGHYIGDQLLREVALRLRRWARARIPRALAQDSAWPGALAGNLDGVSRFGSDEFAMLMLPITDQEGFEALAHDLLETLRVPYSLLGNEIFITASIGLACYPLDGADADTLLRKADIAMVAVKSSGRNGVMRFSEALSPASAGQVRLETDLNRAIERRELVLHYQPKVDVRSGRIVGAEALIRWQRGAELLPPAQFISLAEESGLIVPITEWAVREVCRQLRAWRSQGVAPVPVAVNVSGRHLQRANLTDPVRAALAEFGVPAGWLELELTETVLMQNLEAGLPLLHSLKELGVRLAVDDFGTGYSSLAYLKRLPLHALKVDRSFVREIEGSADSAAIVAAIIAMAESLRLDVVAEGVETRSQMRLLHAQGCSLMQGFHFSAAVTAEAFAELLAGPAMRSDWIAPLRIVPGAPIKAASPSSHAAMPRISPP